MGFLIIARVEETSQKPSAEDFRLPDRLQVALPMTQATVENFLRLVNRDFYPGVT